MSVSSDLWTLFWNVLAGRQSNDSSSDINQVWPSFSPFRTMNVFLVRSYRSSDLFIYTPGTWCASVIYALFDELEKHTAEEIRVMFLEWMRRAAHNVPYLYLSDITIEKVAERSMWIRYKFLDPWPTYISSKSSFSSEIRPALRMMVLIFRRIFPKDILKMLADYIVRVWPTPCSLMNLGNCKGGYIETSRRFCDAVICREHYENLDPTWKCCKKENKAKWMK